MSQHITAEQYAALIDALVRLRVAKYAADEVGVGHVYAWRVAKREKIALIPLAEHQRRRLADPDFRSKQEPAARAGASRWLKQQHKKPKFHKKAVEAARANLIRLNEDPAFRAASSKRLKERYNDPAFRAKVVAATRKAARLRHRDELRPMR